MKSTTCRNASRLHHPCLSINNFQKRLRPPGAPENGVGKGWVCFLEIHNPCPTTYYPIALLIMVCLELPGTAPLESRSSIRVLGWHPRRWASQFLFLAGACMVCRAVLRAAVLFPFSPASVRLPSFTGAIRDWTLLPKTSCCCFSLCRKAPGG